jgi:hypothetical protein
LILPPGVEAGEEVGNLEGHLHQAVVTLSRRIEDAGLQRHRKHRVRAVRATRRRGLVTVTVAVSTHDGTEAAILTAIATRFAGITDAVGELTGERRRGQTEHHGEEQCSHSIPPMRKSTPVPPSPSRMIRKPVDD